MKEKKLGPIEKVKMWLLKKNVDALEKKIYNGTATKEDHELMGRFQHYYKVLTQVR